jgi:hypothetical protein
MAQGQEQQGFRGTAAIVRVPPELWFQIFSELSTSSYSNSNLKNCTLTCSDWSQLAQPRLFHGLTFSFDHPTRSVEQENLRLQFVSSPKVASWVRNCTIRGRERGVDHPNLSFLDRVFSTLPCFSNLNGLSCFNLRLTPLHLSHVHSPPGGLSLFICNCDLAGSIDHPIPVKDMRLLRSSHSLLTIADPSRVERIQLSWVPMAPNSPDQMTTSFPSLRRLHIQFLNGMQPKVTQLLSQARNLRSLTISPGCFAVDFACPNVPSLPMLESYDGPGNWADTFACSGNLRSARFRYDCESILPPASMVSLLDKLHYSADQLESLTFKVKGATAQLFQSIRAFAHLTTLSVTVMQAPFVPACHTAQRVCRDHLSLHDNISHTLTGDLICTCGPRIPASGEDQDTVHRYHSRRSHTRGKGGDSPGLARFYVPLPATRGAQ